MPHESVKSSNCKEAPLKRRHSEAFENEDLENVQPCKQIHIFADDGSLGTSSSEFSPSPTSNYELSSLGSPPTVFSVLGPQNATAISWPTKGDITPNNNKRPVSWNKFSSMSTNEISSTVRQTPLPLLSWAESDEVWQAMCQKDEQSSSERNQDMFLSHPSLQPRMRAILLDWLIEVCEVYKLHRETYYLAIDYLDRYLSGPRKVSKGQLQLIGITCLFIAAKVEEIYPPKIQEFAYVTDTACTDEEILDEELVILKGLNWNITPITVVGWLSMYMQLSTAIREASNTHKQKVKQKQLEPQDSFVLPQFSGLEYSQTCRLLDLCSMDPGLAAFPYSVVAAAAMAHTFNKTHAMHVSGLPWKTLEPCVRWMLPFFLVIAEEPTVPSLRIQDDVVHQSSGLRHICPNLVVDESHTLQTHLTSLEMFDKAQLRLPQTTHMTCIYERSPAPAIASKCPAGLLTPPSSSRKSMDAVNAL